MKQKIYPRCQTGDFVQDYVSADGYVMPCCWVGNVPHSDAYFEIFKDCLPEMSVNNRPLGQIVADPRYKRIEESWTSDNPLSPCAFFCSKPPPGPDVKTLGRDRVADVYQKPKTPEAVAPENLFTGKKFELFDSTKLGTDSKTFCVYPFMHVATTTKGNYRLCCEAKTFEDSVSTTDLETWWQSDKMNGIRAKMLNSETVPECSSCYKKESAGLISKRTKPKPEYQNYKISLSEPVLQSLDIRPGSICNLTCVTCNEEYSSKISEENRKFRAQGNMPAYITQAPVTELWNPESWEKIMKMAPGFSEVYISGGEPMLMKKLIGFLEQLSPDCLVAMNTNMSIYNENFITQLKRFNNICIGASIDGVGARFDFLRQNASFATVAENFSRLRDDLPQAQLEFNFTLSCFNADQLLPTYEFIKNFVQSRGDMRLVITQVSDTAHLSPFNIPLGKRRRLASDLQLFMDANIPLLEQTFSKGYLKNAIELLNLDSPLPEREPALTYLKFLNNNRSIQREVYQDILGLLTNAAPNVHEHVAQLES